MLSEIAELSMTTLYELRILSGLQAGARLRLTDGVYRLGHSEDCDVVIAGHGINEEAMELAINGDSIVATPLQHGCGISLTDNLIEPFSLAPGQVFHLNELWLVVDKESAPWLEQRVWLQMAEAQEEQSKVKHDVQTSSVEDTVLADQSAQATAPVQAAIPEPDVVTRPAVVQRTSYAGWLTIGCMVTLIGGCVWAYMLKQSNDASELKNVNNTNLPIKTAKTPQGNASAIDKTSLNLASVAELVKPAHKHVLVLQTSSLPVSIPAPEALDELRRQLNANQLGGLLNVARVGNAIDINGDLDTVQLRRFEEVLLPFVKKYGEILSINAQFLPPERHLPFTIKQIVSGAMPHVVTSDNVKIFEGGEHKGYRLAAIREHKLIFSGKRSIELVW